MSVSLLQPSTAGECGPVLGEGAAQQLLLGVQLLLAALVKHPLLQQVMRIPDDNC